MITRIQELPQNERPYEKLERNGASRLSDAELLAIILRTGSKEKSALDLARALILRYDDDQNGGGLNFLLDLSLEELRLIEGIGRVKSIQLQAAAEIGKRASVVTTAERLLMNSPDKVAAFVSSDLKGKPREQLVMLILDTKQRLVRQMRVSEGGLASILIQPRDLLREAVRANAAGFILVHNHPSGDPTPSSQDISATKSILEASRLLGVELQDHIVVGHEGYSSIRQLTRLWL